jgi:transcriptional regulator with XRE-family HTH domain
MDRLAEMRERHALTLRELAEMSGVAADTINQIELGHRKPRPSTLRKLARALEVDIDQFYADPALAGKAEAPETGSASIIDFVLDAAQKQHTADWQAIARAKESGQAQGSYVTHENAAFLQLLEYPQGDVAEGLVDLARRYVQDVTQLREENAVLRDRLQKPEQARS